MSTLAFYNINNTIFYYCYCCTVYYHLLLLSLLSKSVFSVMVAFFTDTEVSSDSKGRGGGGIIFTPLYDFHPLMKIQTFATVHVR